MLATALLYDGISVGNNYLFSLFVLHVILSEAVFIRLSGWGQWFDKLEMDIC